MREIGAFEAKNRLGALLDRVERGDEIVITRRGRAVARLVPATQGHDRARALDAARRIRALRQEMDLAGLSPRELIDEGRM